jgi:hypothetical protein
MPVPIWGAPRKHNANVFAFSTCSIYLQYRVFSLAMMYCQQLFVYNWTFFIYNIYDNVYIGPLIFNNSQIILLTLPKHFLSHLQLQGSCKALIISFHLPEDYYFIVSLYADRYDIGQSIERRFLAMQPCHHIFIY